MRKLFLTALLLVFFMQAGEKVFCVNVEYSPLFHYTMGMIYYFEGETDKTIEEFEKAVDYGDNSLLIHKNLLELYALKTDYEKIEREALKVLSVDEKDVAANRYMAEICAIYRKDIDEAIKYQKKVITLAPESVKARLFLGALYGERGEAGPARKTYKGVLKLDRNNFSAYSYLAGVYEYEKKYKDALKVYRKLSAIYPLVTQIYDNMGTIYNKLNRVKEAKKCFLKSIEKNPENVRALYNLVLIYETGRQWGEVINYLEKIVKLQPAVAQTYIHLGISYIEADRFDGAIEVLKKAVELDPEKGAAYTALGITYEYKKMYKEAIGAFSLAIEKNPSGRDNYFHLGLCYDNLKQYSESESAFTRAIELDPEFAQARNYLGYSWADRGVNLDSATVHVEEALRVEPSNGAYLDSLGWIYFKKGNYQEAEKLLKKAIKYLKDPVIYEHLGNTYEKLGLDGKAVVFFRKALSIDSGKRGLEEKIKALSR